MSFVRLGEDGSTVVSFPVKLTDLFAARHPTHVRRIVENTFQVFSGIRLGRKRPDTQQWPRLKGLRQ